MSKSKFQISRSLDERIKRIIGGTSEYDTEFDLVPSAYILGFNYGNVTNCVGLTTNYQLHHAVFPVVGLAFFKCSPNDEQIKASLQSVRQYSSSPNGLGSFKSDKNEHLFLIYSVDKSTNEVEKRIFNFTKGSFVRRKRLRLNILNDPFCPRQVHRGSEDLHTLGDGDSLSSTDDDHIDHLIFFIHGVGGVCDVRFRSCVEVVADFKKMANNLLTQLSVPSSGASTPPDSHSSKNHRNTFLRKHSSGSSSSSGPFEDGQRTKSYKIRRVECLPISWHSCTRRQTGMNDQLNLIALSSVPKLRLFLNKVVLDALLYSSGPVYSQTILNNVGDEINRLYTLFIEKHPNFNGSVSLAGHSLGSVILFDLLANQIPSEQSEPNQIAQSQSNNNNYNDTNHSVLRQCNRVDDDNFNLGTNQYNPLSSPSGLNLQKQYKSLEELLKDMGLSQYAEVFHKEHIDINTLLLLTDYDMKELKLSLGARRELGTYINFKKVSKFQAKPRHESFIQKQEQSISSEKTPDFEHLFDNINTGQYLLKYPQLKFKPRCFFAFGSPTPMFLNIRGIQQLSKEYKLPTCDRIFNIFHPYDPLAYRLEPLLDPGFKNVEPVQVPHHRGGKRIHVQLREGFAKVGHDIKHRIFGSLRNTWSTFTKFGPASDEPSSSNVKSKKRLTKSVSSSVDVEIESFESPKGKTCSKQKKVLKRQQVVRSQSDLAMAGLDSIIEGSVSQSLDAEYDGTDDSNHKNFEFLNHNCSDPMLSSIDQSKIHVETSSDHIEVPFDVSKVGRLNGGRRLDYVLQEKPIELFNEYIFTFTSHANYWQSEDSALMMLNEIYRVDGVTLFDLD